jgi:hypothetical protein
MHDQAFLKEQHFNGELMRVPFLGTASAALARYMPLESENDFDVFAELPSSQSPIFLNFAEHYQILNRLVTQANTLWPEGLCILIRLSMPGGMRLPKALLDANVLLMQDISSEVTRLKGQVPRLLVIEDHLLRYQLEQGHNQMNISFYQAESQADESEAFTQLVDPLTHYGIRPL